MQAEGHGAWIVAVHMDIMSPFRRDAIAVTGSLSAADLSTLHT